MTGDTEKLAALLRELRERELPEEERRTYEGWCRADAEWLIARGVSMAAAPSDEWIEAFQSGYEQRRGYRPEKWMLREIIGQANGVRGVQSSAPTPDPYEYRVTTGPRKAWDQEPDLTKEGWELDPNRGRPGESWERFEYHEEMYWRRLKSGAASTAPKETR